MKAKGENLIVALYERLSHDDELQGESYSIQNQKLLLESYATEHGLFNFRHFFDDGISGTRFDRPAFLQMMGMVKNGEIGTIIVKDMSRLGRDYLVVGQIQEMLRQKGIRLISVNDNFDSNAGDDELLPFKNIMNEWYAKDTSRKVRSTFLAKGKAGKHVASSPIYGYIKDPNDKEKWIVDEEAAEVVRYIYKRTVEGRGPYQIAKELEAKQIEIPAVHLQKLGFGLHQRVTFYEPYKWWGSTVTHLLDKYEYLGYTVNFKTEKHFKDKKSHYVDPSKWVMFPNTQPAIIDQETWDIVHRIRGKCKRYPNGWGENYPLTGLVVCADCGRPMNCHRTSNGKRIANYVCANYNTQPIGVRCPTGHRIVADNIMELLKQTLREIREYIDVDEQAFIQEVEQTSKDGTLEKAAELRKKKEAAEKRIDELENLLCRIYEDNIIGKLPDKRYEILSRQYETEQATLKEELTVITEEMKSIKPLTRDGKKFINIIRKYESFDEMTAYMCNELVEKIVVHERDRKGSIDTTQKIDIYFNFIGDYLPPREEPSPEELARMEEERAKKEAWKDHCHERYLKYKKTHSFKEYEKSYESKRRARLAKLKEENPNTYGISITEYTKLTGGEPKLASEVGMAKADDTVITE